MGVITRSIVYWRKLFQAFVDDCEVCQRSELSSSASAAKKWYIIPISASSRQSLVIPTARSQSCATVCYSVAWFKKIIDLFSALRSFLGIERETVSWTGNGAIGQAIGTSVAKNCPPLYFDLVLPPLSVFRIIGGPVGEGSCFFLGYQSVGEGGQGRENWRMYFYFRRKYFLYCYR